MVLKKLKLSNYLIIEAILGCKIEILSYEILNSIQNIIPTQAEYDAVNQIHNKDKLRN